MCNAAPGIYQPSKDIICIVGPTASGKSELSQRIACAFGGEVVSADSMQIYRGMDIGTGKVPANKRRVKHWGLDILEIGQPYSASLFQTYARTCFQDIDKRGKRAVLCGGTGFYVRAAIDAYEFPKGEQIGNSVRHKYQSYLAANGPEALWAALNDTDPESAALIHPADSKRVIRAFELLDDGTSYAKQKAQLASLQQALPAKWLGLEVDPDILRARIDARVDQMFEDGLVLEVKSLVSQGFRESLTASQAIGYREVVQALDGEMTFDEARQAIKYATHRYAKRQRTWFKKDSRIVWVDANEPNEDLIFSKSCEALGLV